MPHIRNSYAPLALLAISLIVGVSAANASSEICEGFKKAQRIESLGGANALSRERTATIENLQTQVKAHWEEISGLLEERELGHLADGLSRAIASGNVTERKLIRGEEFHWMAWRKGGKAVTSGPICYSSRGDHDAWQISVDQVTEDDESMTTTPHLFVIPKDCLNLTFAGAHEAKVVAKAKPKPTCAISAERSCNEEGHSFSVDASGSTAGSRVVMIDGAKETEVITSTNTTLRWQGADENPYRSDVTFTVFGPEPGCEESVELERCKAPPAECSIAVVESAYSRQGFDVSITGHKELSLAAAGADGVAVEVTSPMTIKSPGVYTFTGTAVNEAGEEATCSAAIDIDARWTLRPFVGRVDVGTNQIAESATLPDGTNERNMFSVEDGQALGLGLEYHISDRVGIEGDLIYGNLDSSFKLDFDNDWEMDTGDISMLTFTVGPNFHFTPDKKVDVFLGPFIGVADYGSSDYTALGETVNRSLDGEFMWGVQLGADIPFGAASRWGLFLGLRYMDSTAEGQGRFEFELPLDPTMFNLGLSWGF